jgi:hypothetical protein
VSFQAKRDLLSGEGAVILYAAKNLIQSSIISTRDTRMTKITDLLTNLKGDIPKPHALLSEEEKEALIQKIGSAAVKDILKAKETLPLARIPFLFSSIDTQAVVDILAHDFTSALAAAEKRKAATKLKKK